MGTQPSTYKSEAPVREHRGFKNQKTYANSSDSTRILRGFGQPVNKQAAENSKVLYSKLSQADYRFCISE